MKKLGIVLLALCLLGAVPLVAEDAIGLDVGLELATGDFLDGGFALEMTPSVSYTLGESGFSFYLGWTAPLVPSFGVGSLELIEDYDFEVGEFGITIENGNTLTLSTMGIEGYVELAASWKVLSMGFDFTYLPGFAIDAWLAADWSTDVGPGTLGLGAAANFALYSAIGLGDLEGYVSYEIPAGPVTLLFELDPVLSGLGEGAPAFGLSALVAATMSL